MNIIQYENNGNAFQTHAIEVIKNVQQQQTATSSDSRSILPMNSTFWQQQQQEQQRVVARHHHRAVFICLPSLLNVALCLLLLLFLLLPILPQTNGARILFTGAIDSGTHIGSMLPLINSLASAGHRLTVLEIATLDKARELGPNVTVHFIRVPVQEGFTNILGAAMFRETLNGRTLHLPYVFGNARFAEFMQTHTQMFVHLLNDETFDLVVLDELFGVHSFAIALHLYRYRSIPYVIYSTTMMIQSSAYALALGRNFLSEPNLLTSSPTDSTDKYRPRLLMNRLDNLRTISWDLVRVVWQSESLLANPRHSSLPLLGLTHFSFREFFEHASYTFVDYLDHVPAPMAEGSDLLPIFAHCRPPQPLPADLATFVDDPHSAGTIYVAFGTNVHWRLAPASMLAAFFRALNRLTHYRVIFAFNGVKPAGIVLGAHFKLIPWAPQYDILCHPRTRLFISHGGLKSFKETICAKVPTVYMPVYAEQAYNTKVALRLGFAAAVSKFSITEQELHSAIQMVLSDYGRFKRNAERANAFFLDRPVSGLQLAHFGIRRAIQQHARFGKRWRKWRTRKGIGMPAWRHLNGDLAALLLVLIAFLAWI